MTVSLPAASRSASSGVGAGRGRRGAGAPGDAVADAEDAQRLVRGLCLAVDKVKALADRQPDAALRRQSCRPVLARARLDLRGVQHGAVGKNGARADVNVEIAAKQEGVLGRHLRRRDLIARKAAAVDGQRDVAVRRLQRHIGGEPCACAHGSVGDGIVPPLQIDGAVEHAAVDRQAAARRQHRIARERERLIGTIAARAVAARAEMPAVDRHRHRRRQAAEHGLRHIAEVAAAEIGEITAVYRYAVGMRRDQIRLRRGKVRLRHRTAEKAELAAALQRGRAVLGEGDIVIAAENIVGVPRNGDRRVDHDVVGCGRGQELQPHGENQSAACRSDLQFARLRRDLRFLFDGRIPAEHDAPALAVEQCNRRIQAAARRGRRRARARAAVRDIHRACLGGKCGHAQHTKNRRRGKQADHSLDNLHRGKPPSHMDSS